MDQYRPFRCQLCGAQQGDPGIALALGSNWRGSNGHGHKLHLLLRCADRESCRLREDLRLATGHVDTHSGEWVEQPGAWEAAAAALAACYVAHGWPVDRERWVAARDAERERECERTYRDYSRWGLIQPGDPRYREVVPA